ncbi:MAG: glycosyltransferase family 1 protein [Candidatus Stahlbacteria bacterium]|nr:MAG: glycosyltransferase family 1 protein [Candidatus Stahlbacteria bacterium]
MVQGLRLGIYLHDRYRGDGNFTVSNSESLNFIRRLKLAEQISLAVSVTPIRDIDPENYRVVVENLGIKLFPLPGWRDLAQSIVYLPFSLGRILKAARGLIKSSDILWLRIPAVPGFFFWWLARKQRKPLIIHVAGNVLLSARTSKYKGLRLFAVKLASYALHLLMRWITCYGVVLVTGGELEKLFSTHLYPAYQLDDILLSEKNLLAPRKTKGQAKELLFVGRFDYGKGIELLVDVVEELHVDFPALRLRLAGSGPLFEPIRKKTAERGLGSYVKLLGFVPSTGPLQKLYRETDIFVLPSDSYPEGFPRVILEAWAQGLPVLATRLGGIPYRIRHGENGLVVDPGDRNQLRDTLRMMIKDDTLRYKLAQGGRETVKSLTFEHQARRIRKLLHKYYPNLGIHP